jgi:hypothetical protein
MQPVFPSSSTIWGHGDRLWLCFQADEEDSQELCSLDRERRNSLYVRGGPSGHIHHFLFILNFNQERVRDLEQNLHQCSYNFI